MKDVLAAMYGASDDEPTQVTKLTEATNEFEIKTQTKNFVTLKVGKETVSLPVAKYIKSLEDKIEKLERDADRQRSDYKKIKSVVERLGKDVQSMDKELKDKMDRF